MPECLELSVALLRLWNPRPDTPSHLTQAILPCLNRPEMFSQLFMDSLFTLMICSHLVGKRHAQTHGSLLPQFKGGLAPWQKHRVVELLREHLDGELKLATLADECGISVSHFARSFRRSFGTSAHRYLILKRVEIAKALFCLRKLKTNSLVEVAARQTGFLLTVISRAYPRRFTKMWSVRLRQSGGVNTHVAEFLSKYPNANSFNHTNRSHPQVQRPGAVLLGIISGRNIVASLRFG